MNCELVGWAHADGVTLGFYLDGLVQNVLVNNCDILYASGQGHTGGHAAFSIVCDDHGDVRDIRFVTFDNCRVGGKLLTNLSDADFQVEFAKDIKFIPSTEMKRGILSKE
jgi:hypothetical protein